MLDAATITLILLASPLHASWHSLVKSSTDPIVLLAGMGFIAAVVAAIAAPWLPLPSAHAWAIIAGRCCCTLDTRSLWRAATRSATSVRLFPLARGLVQLFSTVIAFVFRGQLPSLGQILGTLVSTGLLWLATHFIHGGVDRRIWLSTVAAGLAVACYSVVDAYGWRANRR